MYIYGVVSKARNPFSHGLEMLMFRKSFRQWKAYHLLWRAESACAQYGARNGLVERTLGSNEKNSSHRLA